jgi:hypothetical protein
MEYNGMEWNGMKYNNNIPIDIIVVRVIIMSS